MIINRVLSRWGLFEVLKLSLLLAAGLIVEETLPILRDAYVTISSYNSIYQTIKIVPLAVCFYSQWWYWEYIIRAKLKIIDYLFNQ